MPNPKAARCLHVRIKPGPVTDIPGFGQKPTEACQHCKSWRVKGPGAWYWRKPKEPPHG